MHTTCLQPDLWWSMKSFSTLLSEIVKSTIMRGISPVASGAHFLDKVEEEITHNHCLRSYELQSQLLKLHIKRYWVEAIVDHQNHRDTHSNNKSKTVEISTPPFIILVPSFYYFLISLIL
ncbi:hypothetical protein VP01_2947g2 [Puccinia sorghi]|uniref:Uncharacterized protein n=1 Tax=Puccinia sorghi TaxID=27349 RepID=A0A0L6V126_9BASI|nr:hypothetical protein VP01_2947g2 [Puccinia sorghi]